MRDAIAREFARLEATHGETLVQAALAYVTHSHRGLSSDELMDVLSLDDEVLRAVAASCDSLRQRTRGVPRLLSQNM